MSDDPTESAGVVDSIRDGIAVVLVGDDETTLEVRADRLPEGTIEGSRVRVTMTEDTVEVELVEAAPSTDDLRGRLEALAKRQPSTRLRGW